MCDPISFTADNRTVFTNHAFAVLSTIGLMFRKIAFQNK